MKREGKRLVGLRQLVSALCWSALLSPVCTAFAIRNLESRSIRGMTSSQKHASSVIAVGRHGNALKKRSSTTELSALQDFSGAAGSLFGNLIGPASMIAGGLVPLGFLAGEIPGDKSNRKRLQTIYFLIAIFSLANELLAIMYATVASNKLTETVVAPAASVFALLQRDYELSWIGTNVHFITGLFGFMAMVGIRAYAFLPSHVHLPATGLAASFFLSMISVVNRGIAEGNRQGQVFGSSIVSLMVRYMKLLLQQSVALKSPLALTALILGVCSMATTVWRLAQDNSGN